MTETEICEKISAIAKKYTKVNNLSLDTPLTAHPYRFDSIKLAAIFIDIEKIFSVNLNCIFDKDLDFSIRSITRSIYSCL